MAKLLIKPVSQLRASQYSMDVASPVVMDNDYVFPELPIDAGHFGVPYLSHVLNGLRNRPPTYVQRLIDNPRATLDIPHMEALGGITIVSV